MNILDALLIARENKERIEEIKKQYKLPFGQLEEEFEFNHLQAKAIIQIKKDLSEISVKSIIDEKDKLNSKYNTLMEIIT